MSDEEIHETEFEATEARKTREAADAAAQREARERGDPVAMDADDVPPILLDDEEPSLDAAIAAFKELVAHVAKSASHTAQEQGVLKAQVKALADRPVPGSPQLRDIACSLRAMALAHVVSAEVALDAAVNAADHVANFAKANAMKQHHLTKGGTQLNEAHRDGLARARDALAGRR